MPSSTLSSGSVNHLKYPFCQRKSKTMNIENIWDNICVISRHSYVILMTELQSISSCTFYPWSHSFHLVWPQNTAESYKVIPAMNGTNQLSPSGKEWIINGQEKAEATFPTIRMHKLSSEFQTHKTIVPWYLLEIFIFIISQLLYL